MIEKSPGAGLLRVCVALVLASLLGACSMFSGGPKFVTLDGSIAYSVPADHDKVVSIVVDVMDITAGPGQSTVLTQIVFDHPVKLPLPFSLTYDARNVVPAHRYAVTATLFLDQRAVQATPAGRWEFTGALPEHVALVLAPIELPPGATR